MPVGGVSGALKQKLPSPVVGKYGSYRQAYNTPLLRRLLLNNLEAQGFVEVFLDSRVVGAKNPGPILKQNGYRYHRDALDIRAIPGRIRVIENGNTREARVYGGTLTLQTNTYGTYTLVNDVPIETYLRGGALRNWGGRACSCNPGPGGVSPYLCPAPLRRLRLTVTSLCRYPMPRYIEALPGRRAVTDQAIQATRGQVLTYKQRTGRCSLFFTHRRHHRALQRMVWDGPDRPYLRSVVDSVYGVWDINQYPLSTEQNLRAFMALDEGFNEETWDLFRWDYDSSLTEIAQDLKGYLKQAPASQAGRPRSWRYR